MDQARCLGVDVSKAWLDVASHPDGPVRRLPNTPEGVAAYVRGCQNVLLEELTRRNYKVRESDSFRCLNLAIVLVCWLRPRTLRSGSSIAPPK